MPLLQATGLAPAVATNNAEDFILNTVNAELLWKFDRQWNQPTPALGSGPVGTEWDIPYDNGGMNQRLIGPGRGAPPVYALRGDIGDNGFIGNNAFSQRSIIMSDEGTVGIWMRVLTGRYNTAGIDAWPKWGFSYTSSVNFSTQMIYIAISPEGDIRWQWSAGSTAFARWFWSGTTIRNYWMRNPGDTIPSGDIWVHIVITNRNDGVGPRLFLNGQPQAAPTFTVNNSFGGPPIQSDDWLAGIDAKQMGVDPSISNFRLKMQTQYGVFCDPFVSTTSLSDADALALYNSYNPDGPVAQYHEYVQAIRPDYWRTFGPRQTGASSFVSQRQWWAPNIANPPATGAGREEFMDEQFGGSTLQAFSLLENAPGWGHVAYRQHGIRTGPSFDPSTVNSALSPRFDDVNTNANGFNVGTLCIIFEMPLDNRTGGAEDQMIWEIVNGNQPTTQRMRVSCSNTQVILRVQLSSTNITTVALDRPSAVGTVNMLTYVQTGNPAAAIRTYWNGVLRDGSDIGTTLGGTNDGTEWIGDFTFFSWSFGYPYAMSFIGWQAGRLTRQMYDLWYTRQQLTSQEIADLYDVAVGNKQIATPPAPLN